MKPVMLRIACLKRAEGHTKEIAETETMLLLSKCLVQCNHEVVYNQSALSKPDLASQSFFLHQAEGSRDGQRGEQTPVILPSPSSQHQLRELLEAWSRLWQTPGEFRTQSQNETPLSTSLSHVYTYKYTRSFMYFNIVTFFDQLSFSRSSFRSGPRSTVIMLSCILIWVWIQFECIVCFWQTKLASLLHSTEPNVTYS